MALDKNTLNVLARLKRYLGSLGYNVDSDNVISLYEETGFVKPGDTLFIVVDSKKFISANLILSQVGSLLENMSVSWDIPEVEQFGDIKDVGVVVEDSYVHLFITQKYAGLAPKYDLYYYTKVANTNILTDTQRCLQKVLYEHIADYMRVLQHKGYESFNSMPNSAKVFCRFIAQNVDLIQRGFDKYYEGSIDRNSFFRDMDNLVFSLIPEIRSGVLDIESDEKAGVVHAVIRVKSGIIGGITVTPSEFNKWKRYIWNTQ